MIKEITYWCKDCELPFADEVFPILLAPTEEGKERERVEVKTGDLICLQCKKEIKGNREYK